MPHQRHVPGGPRLADDQAFALENLASLLARLTRNRDLRADAQDRDAICSHLAMLGFDDSNEPHSYINVINAGP